MLAPRLDASERIAAHRALELALGNFPELTGDQAEFDEPHAKFAHYREKPCEFVREVIGVNPWQYTDEFLLSILKNPRTAVRGPRGMAKTFTYAMAGLTWMSTRRAIVLCFGAREDNIKNQLFAEVGLWHSRSKIPLPGKVENLQWKLGPRHYMQGIATKSDLGAIGFHAGRVVPPNPNTNLTADELDALYQQAREAGKLDAELLILCDEALSIPNKILLALQGSIQGETARFAMTSNPLTDPESDHMFARAFKENSGFHRIQVSRLPLEEGQDEVGADVRLVVPNWLVRDDYVAQARKQYGEDDPRWFSDVLGLFPKSSLELQMVPRPLLKLALRSKIEDPGTLSCRHMGVDLAASEFDSADPCVAYLAINNVISARHEWRAANTMQTVGVILELMEFWGIDGEMIPGENVHIDRNGLGRGVCDRLHEKGYHVDAIDPGGGPRNDWPALLGQEKILNRRAELMWIFRRGLQEGMFKVPEDIEFAGIWTQAAWHTWAVKARGNESLIFCNIDKPKLKELYTRSPDDFDAACYCFSRTSSKLEAPRVISPRQLGKLRGPGRILGWNTPPNS